MRTGAAIRWTGRIWSLASLAFLISFAVGSREMPTAAESVGLVFFPGGVAAGMLLAWRREGLGGAVTVLSIAAFYAWSFLRDGRFPHGPWFILTAVPGFLFLLARDFERPRSRPAE